mmetsp:Transcript_899/g.2539  ORF Transcript_899/g.2539 Transcript_899/m.2539 type:complete len:313 (+) Transcript_899:58-996(+)
MTSSPTSLEARELLPRLVCSSLSCVVADSLCLPMDTLKVRMQLQNELLPPSTPRLSFVGMSHQIFKGEGPFAFWAGLRPAMARQAIYGGLSYWSYPMVRDRFQPWTGLVPAQVLAGVMSGGAAAAIANPTDVVKVRLQADGRRVLQGLERRYPRSAFGTARQVFQKEGGLLAFYGGLGPNVSRASVVNGVGMFAYDASKNLLRPFFDERQSPLLLRFCAALVGGAASTVAGCPFDVLKTRLMAPGSRFTSALDCLVSTVRTEGPFALWKGAWPVYGRQAPFNLLNYLIMEALLDLYYAQTTTNKRRPAEVVV